MKKKSGSSGKITIIVFVILAVVILAFIFLKQINKSGSNSASDKGKQTELQKIINKDLDANYPKTPTAVVKFYCSLSKEVHGADVTEEQVEKVYPQLRKLFSEEQLANNKYNDGLKALKEEVEQYQKNKILITRYAVLQEADQVSIYVDDDGNDCTKIPIMYKIKNGNKWVEDYQQIIMRKDEDGNWKLMGMQSIEKPDDNEDEE